MDLEEDYSKHFHNKPKIKEKNIDNRLHKYFIGKIEDKEKFLSFVDKDRFDITAIHNLDSIGIIKKYNEYVKIYGIWDCCDCIDMTLIGLDEKIVECDKVTFSDLLFKIIKSENIDDVELYKKADIDRKLFSKIRSDRHYKPSKETVIKLIFALEADSEMSERLMSLAGYHLSGSLLSDTIVNFFIENNIYDKALLDKALVYYDQKTIFSEE